MNSDVIRRDADRLKTFARDRVLRLLFPVWAKTAHNHGVLLECIADLNDRLEHIEARTNFSK